MREHKALIVIPNKFGILKSVPPPLHQRKKGFFFLEGGSNYGIPPFPSLTGRRVLKGGDTVTTLSNPLP
jgi:hypothetical protein